MIWILMIYCNPLHRPDPLTFTKPDPAPFFSSPFKAEKLCLKAGSDELDGLSDCRAVCFTAREAKR